MRRAAIHIQARRSAAAPELTQRQRAGAVEYPNYCALLASSGELAAIMSEGKSSKLVVVGSDQRRLALAGQRNANLRQRGGGGGKQRIEQRERQGGAHSAQKRSTGQGFFCNDHGVFLI